MIEKNQELLTGSGNRPVLAITVLGRNSRIAECRDQAVMEGAFNRELYLCTSEARLGGLRIQ